MSKRTIIVLFIIHAVLMVLASTNFSILSWFQGDFSWNFSYYEYSYSNGWGYDFVSDYSIEQVLCYVAAYGLGVVVFAIGWLRNGIWPGVLAMVLCFIGLVSFFIELTHWFWSHHLSLIASFPAVMVVLWVIIGIKLIMSNHRNSLSLKPVKV